MEYPKVEKIVFKGKQSIDWDAVKTYMKVFQGNTYIVAEYQDSVGVNNTTLEEYTGSRYTWRLKGTLAKAKANVVQILPELLHNATNRRWIENKSSKHSNNASKGWYRYDTFFAIPVQAENEKEVRWNHFHATMVVRLNDRGLYLYDIIDIKKEASNPR